MPGQAGMRGQARSSSIIASAPRQSAPSAGPRAPMPTAGAPAEAGGPGRCAWAAIQRSTTAWRWSGSF